MSNFKGATTKKLLSMILSLTTVFSMLPITSMTVVAATDEHPDVVTITVVDESGQPIKDAVVEYTIDSSEHGASYKFDTKTTDATGVVDVIATDDFIDNDLTLNATISATNYDEGSIVNKAILTDKDNFDVTLASNMITDVSIVGKNLIYSGEPQDLVSVTKIPGDVISYKVDGLDTGNEAKRTDAKTYNIEVTVTREGKQPLVKNVTTTISPKNIDDIDIQAKEDLKYDGTQLELVELSGSFLSTDVVTWKVNDIDTLSRDIPKDLAVGNYKVELRVERDSNHNVFEKTVNVEIGLGELNISGLKITTNDRTYDGKEKDSLTVTNKGDYDLQYKLGDDGQWIDNTIPKIQNADSYKVYVRATKDNYAVQNFPTFPLTVTISKADQELRFKNTLPNEEEVAVAELNAGKTFDFEAIDDKKLGAGTISYKVDIVDGDSDIASISEAGLLTVTASGVIKITATLSGNDNYNECVIEHTITVSASNVQGELVKFAKGTTNYIVGDNAGIPENLASKTVAKDKGKITYSIENANEFGLSIDNSGKITVTDYKKLIAAVSKQNGQLNVMVRADKSADKGIFGRVKYKADYTTYSLQIAFLSTPENPYTLSEPDGVNIDGTSNDWYITKAVVTPVTGYKIAKTEVNAKANNFESSVDFDNQGVAKRYVYLQEEVTGKITNAVEVNVKIDTIAPDANNMKVEIQNLNIVQKLGIKFGFYNPEVTIKFTVEDEVNADESGVQAFNWYYTKDSNAVASIVSSKSGNLTPVKENNKYVATLKIPASEVETYRGNISFTVMDGAGNVSPEKKESNNPVIVVDKINPTMVFSHSSVDIDGKYNPVNEGAGITRHYYDSSVEVTFTIEEQNFFNEDVNISVSKNGGADTKVNNVVWTTDSTNDQLYYGKFTLSGDGDYVVKMTYKDQSNNVMVDSTTMSEIATYISEVITIDETAPEVKMEYIHNDDVQKTIFTVKEHNFNPSHVVVTGTMLDINNNPIDYTPEELTKLLQTTDKWNKNGDTYTFETDAYVDGLYDLAIDYTDYSGNKAKQYDLPLFIIDHTAPNDVDIEIVTNPIETLLNVVTFGFYNPSVTIKFTAYDSASGVKDFTWNYTKENGASDINRPTDEQDTVVKVVQDSQDKSKFTATVTLPDTSETQLRGYLAVYATDNYNNNSEKVTDDDQIIVVDTIAPEVFVEYSTPSRVVGNNSYYNGDIETTVRVNEANFYESDVIVKIAKDGGSAERITPTWSTDKNNSDIHYGKYTITGDGDYIVSVEYKDKSDNFDVTKSTYTSNKLIIDTIKPVINVKYNNNNVINKLEDSEKNNREYFKDTQTAEVTITEHNFDADEVDFTIIAKDVTGKEIDENTVYSKSSWKLDSTGDVHTITITYPGDANYTFDVNYTDLATNKADDYATDYFTVDNTKASIQKVDYSTSVLDTILENITFGFYKAKTKVTITAEDMTSGVHSFNYRYVKAAGVSSVNSDIEMQEIVSKDIEYSSDNKTAVASFEIPKMVLANDNQFNGTVEVSATDCSGNKTDIHKETKRIVVDNISPTAQVSYNDPVNTVGDVSYYNGNINATITINEANFYASDVQVSVSKDGSTSTVNANWSNNGVDVHVGTFTLTEDGDYLVTVNYKDKSGNTMATYTSKQMTIDTKIEAPTYSINGVAKTEEGGAYKKEANIAFNYEDQNFDTQTIKLTRTRFDVTEDVTEEFVKANNQDKGGSGSFEIPSEVKNDGIYVLSVGITDKAKHTAESQMKFTINRFGSVYEYDDYLVSLIKDGGQYVTIEKGEKAAITKDLVITEYNADRLIEDSLKVLVTRDGEVVDVDYTTTPIVINNQVKIGESGWYQYKYVIKASNFEEDGVYKIALKSMYETSDSNNNESSSIPDNSIDSKGDQIVDTMNFTVDTTKPEIRNIVNLDQKIPDVDRIIDGKLNVKYTVVDVGGLKSIDVVLNGKTIDTITEFEDVMNYSGEFDIPEDSVTQTVQLRVVDIAGNVTDTASEDFNTGDLYIFNNEITVSRNFFVRWYANKVLFWGSIAGVVALVGGIWGAVAYRKKKKEENE